MIIPNYIFIESLKPNIFVFGSKSNINEFLYTNNLFTTHFFNINIHNNKILSHRYNYYLYLNNT
jgi:hypothetical protein